MKMQAIVLTVAALVGVAVSTPAQVQLRARTGNGAQVGVSIGSRPVRQAPAPAPALVPHRQFTNRRDAGDHRHDARDNVWRGPKSGHWHVVSERVWVPGYWREEHVPATYGWSVDVHGHRVQIVLQPACTHRVWVPGYYETRQRRVWVNH